MSKKLVVTLSVALLSARMSGAASDPTVGQALDELESLIESNDLVAVQSFLHEHDVMLSNYLPLTQEGEQIIQRGFVPDAFNYDEARYTKKRWKRATLRKRIKHYRKSKRRDHIY